MLIETKPIEPVEAQELHQGTTALQEVDKRIEILHLEAVAIEAIQLLELEVPDHQLRQEHLLIEVLVVVQKAMEQYEALTAADHTEVILREVRAVHREVRAT